ncbi:MAG: prolyl oligopeptidase family serine peptidase [Verrucomicrobiota bacterium]|nr:prolyl oligopeptidase family serine peptidase [Verrucomicrobiota bacterium]
MFRNTLTFTIAIGLIYNSALARELKEFDNNVNYDESKVPHYDLPDPLTTAEGTAVTNAKQWRNIRRPQILSLFANFIYGTVPTPPDPIQQSYQIIKEDKSFLDNKATKLDISIRFKNRKGTAQTHIIVFIPNQIEKPAPAFMMMSFDNPRGSSFQLSNSRKGHLRNGVPLVKLIDNGYGYISVYHGDLIGHNEVSFGKGIHKLFFRDGQSFPKAHEWGVLGANAWTGMRALDYLETNDRIDAKRIAIMGHSKMGKATLWAAAQDERFALAISAQSGCGGAALWRRKFGETMLKLNRFPHWLCINARKFNEREDDLPVDQHMLLSLIAPRPVYVASGTADTWADPHGEFQSAKHAGPVYRLLGKKPLSTTKIPSPNQPLLNGDIGYHLRTGGHSVAPYDWEQFIRFANNHLKK